MPAHPHATIRLSHDAAPVLASAAADAQLEIAFIDGPTDPARLTRTEIGHDDLVLAVPQNDPLTKRASIDLADPALRDRDFADYRADSALRAQIDVACAAASLARRTAAEHGRIHADPFEVTSGGKGGAFRAVGSLLRSLP
jgi:DNA-binding transcriptional LysR family regulator